MVPDGQSFPSVDGNRRGDALGGHEAPQRRHDSGIQPQAPGFKKVLVRPLLQKLDKVSGSMAHWAGTVDVKLEKKGKQLTGTIMLPSGITGRLEWEQKVVELKSGENKIEVN